MFNYLIIINIISVLLMFIDKQKSIKHKNRIEEKLLFLISILGGALGTLFGMYLFHHKTKKAKFYILIPLILIIQVIIILYCKYNNIVI